MVWLLWMLACGGEEDPNANETPKVDPRSLVEAGPVSRGEVGSVLTASGAVESEAQATLVPQAQGRVTGIYAEEGDQVREGQLLAVIASPTLDAAYERATAELQRSQTDFATAERLFSQGALSKADLDMARQALHLAETVHQEASQTRGFTRLVSPISGTVALRNLRYGEMAGMQPAFTIVDLDRLRVVIHLPERELQRVHENQPVTLVSAWDEELKESGRVLRLSPVVDPTSGTFKVTLAIDAGQTKLRPGQYASARIQVDRHADVLTLPRRALVWEEGKAAVFVLADGPGEADQKKKEEKEEEKGAWERISALWGAKEEEKKEEELPGPWRRAVRTPVSVGYEDGEKAEILEGVTEGQQVVIVGNEALRDGTRVRLPGDPTVQTKKDDETPK